MESAAISRDEFTSILFRLMREIFEGPASHEAAACLDPGGGLLEILDTISADVASRPLVEGGGTIAGHVAHVDYYVRSFHALVRGERPTFDWPGSWRTSRVDAREWSALRDRARASFQGFVATLEGIMEWRDASIGPAMAVVVHTAYHLGALRQVLRGASEGKPQ